jgi:hypothetical protein
MSSTRPQPSTITKSAFARLLQLYPEVQETAYKVKVKDPKKLATAQQDHDWRYDELPKLLVERNSKSSSAYLDKGELVRLTQWKIVHGKHRPFLPGMVKKNEQDRVKEATTSTFDIQAGASYGGIGIPESLDKALREAAQLHGIGPATATLICSIYDPTNVCFFEDELAAWLCPNLPKLKYTWAEYKLLFTEMGKLRTMLCSDYKAVDIEKVGFVIGHLRMVDAEQKEALMLADQIEGETEQDTKKESKPSAVLSTMSDSDDNPSKASKPRASRTKRKGKAGEDIPAKQDDTKSKAKRRRK